MDVLYCAGEQARVVLDILRRTGTDSELVLVDDDESLHGTEVGGYEVVGGRTALRSFDSATDRCLVAFGDEQGVRLELARVVREAGLPLFNAVDPDATVAATATVGDGVVVNAQSYVGPDAHIGDVVLIDSAVNVSHDVVLEPGVTVGPNATVSGGVRIGRDAYIGAGATILDDVEVGTGARLGAGATVIADVPPYTTVVGVPAEPVGEG